MLPSSLLNTAAFHRLADALLTTEPVQRARLAQAGLAMLLLAAAVLAMNWFVWTGAARALPVRTWSALTLAGTAVFFVLIRSGWSRHFADPSLTVPQMLFALTSGAVAYTLLGPGRGAVFPVVMVILMFGMFVASPRQMRWVGVYAVALFAVVMALAATVDPVAHPPAIEFGHFLLVAMMMPAVAILAGRLSRLRHRARLHRTELAQALARLREQSTRDELTGLANRRQMELLLAQEHQRCTRSGQSFCVALIDVDRYKRINRKHGYACGDAVLRTLAEAAQRHVRVCDMLGRWTGGTLLLLMPDTRAALARGGVDRLHQRLSQVRTVHEGVEVVVTLSAGLTVHLPGESVAQTLERAAQALAEAKAQGGDRVVAAP